MTLVNFHISDPIETVLNIITKVTYSLYPDTKKH